MNYKKYWKNTVLNVNKKILLHSCCGICSAYSILLLKELGYEVIVYFCNPNLDTSEEFNRRKEAQEVVCKYHQVELLIEPYDHLKYLYFIKGLENEPEKGSRCEKCIELRLIQSAEKAKALNIEEFTTSLPISPHKNFQKISQIGQICADKYGVKFTPIDFKKKDGFFKTNEISKELNLYRQNYCGCEFAK